MSAGNVRCVLHRPSPAGAGRRRVSGALLTIAMAMPVAFPAATVAGADSHRRPEESTTGGQKVPAPAWAFGGSARARLENWQDFAFGVPATNDDAFAVWRVTGHMDLRALDRLRVFVELKSALVGDRDLPGGAREIDADTFELQQAFLDLTTFETDRKRFVFRLGRQALRFGKERLVSPLPWGNTLRHWDGVTSLVEVGDWSTSTFWTRPIDIDKTDLNRPDSTRSFYGIYAQHQGAGPLDLYFLGQGRDETTSDRQPGHEDRYTFGARVERRPLAGRLRVEVEAAIQTGEAREADIRAWMLASETVASWPRRRGEPTFGLVLEMASGDDGPGGDVETFDQLFPLGHAYLGIADFVARQNIVAVSLPLALRPAAQWKLVLRPYLFRRHRNTDALYNAGGGIVFAGDAGASRDIGLEIDVTVARKIGPYTTASAGYAHFRAGDFIQEAGGRDDMEFAYAQIEFRY